jgi:hypothetical protein
VEDSGKGRVGWPGGVSTKRGEILEFCRANQKGIVVEPFISGMEE